MEFLLLLILLAAKGSPLGGFAKLLQNEPLRSLPVGSTTAGELASAAQKLGFLTGEKQPCAVLPAAGGDGKNSAAENKKAAFSAAENSDTAFSAAAGGDTESSSGSSPWNALARLAAAKDAFAEFSSLLRALGAGAQRTPQTGTAKEHAASPNGCGAAGEIAETAPCFCAAGVRCAAAEQNGGAAETLSDAADSQSGAHPHGKAACNPFAPIAPFAPDEYVSALNRCFA